jgi:tetratricopeptide (TPR) repeat protein
MKIFISYKKEDSSKAFLFFHAIESNGYNGWMYEKHCFGGVWHRKQVEEAIMTHEAFIIIMTKNSIASDEVTFEIQIALRENKPIFPIYYDLDWEVFLRIKTDWRKALEQRTGICAAIDPDKAIKDLITGLKNEGISGNSDIEQESVETRERIVPVKYTGSLDHFINRTEELKSINDFVNDEITRMIMLTGPGGYGKSALVEKFLFEITDQYSIKNTSYKHGIDSIIWLNLSEEESRSVEALFNLLVKTFPKHKANDFIKGWQGEASLSRKLEFLFGRLLSRDRRLIIFDNFESILENTKISKQYNDIEKFIESFLNTDHVSILVITSRKSLSLDHVTEGKHGGIRKKEIPLDYGLPEHEAINLIMKLDTEGLCLTKETNRKVLIDIVNRLNCAPRALEILIGILKTDDKNIEEFYLEEEFYDLIANPAKELINSLPLDQKQVLEVISILNRPVSKVTIQWFFPNQEIRCLLASLVKCYAIKKNISKHYFVHSIFQSIVYKQIPIKGVFSKIQLHSKAADWYASQRLDQEKWLGFDDVQTHINEIQHRILAEEYDKACEVLNLIDREYLAVWNYYNLIIQLRTDMMGKISDERLNELNMGNLGCAYLETGRAFEAKELYLKSLEISRELNNVFDECRWLGNIAVAEDILGNKEIAGKLMEEALQIAENTNNYLHIGRWRGKLANMKLSRNILSIQETILELEKALETTRNIEIRDKRFEYYWLRDLHFYHNYLGNNKIAAAFLDEAIEVLGSMGDFKNQAEYLSKSFYLKSTFNEPIKVIESLEKAFELKLRIGRQEEAYNVGKELADLYLKYGITDKALEKYRQMLDFTIEVGNNEQELSHLEKLGITHYLRNDFTEAVFYYQKYIEKSKELNKTTQNYNHMTFNLGDTYLQLLEFDKATEYLTSCLKNCSLEVGFIANFELALIHLRHVRNDKSEECYNECFKYYLQLEENNELRNQIKSIYSVVLMLRGKEKESLEILQEIFNDINIDIYTLEMALHDSGIVKKVLPEAKNLNKISELINEKILKLSEEKLLI